MDCYWIIITTILLPIFIILDYIMYLLFYSEWCLPPSLIGGNSSSSSFRSLCCGQFSKFLASTNLLDMTILARLLAFYPLLDSVENKLFKLVLLLDKLSPHTLFIYNNCESEQQTTEVHYLFCTLQWSILFYSSNDN